MWVLVMLLTAPLTLAALACLVVGFHRFTPFQRLATRHRALSWLLAAVPVAAIGFGFLQINIVTSVVVLLHLLFVWLLCGLAARLFERWTHRKVSHDVRGLAAIALTAVYLGVGWFMAHHVFETHYALETAKDLGGQRLRIAAISDAHLGITLDGDGFARQMARVQQAQPDAVVIVGDFVDDDTEAADMLAACAALGRLEVPYGVYFVFGNHDEGYFDHRDFTAAQLRAALRQNGVTVLEDEHTSAGDALCIVGRKDRSSPGRLDMDALTDGLDPAKYTILLDHQPDDYANEAAPPVDLVLSGHTHGGHIFPAGLIGLAFGANDRVYGMEARGDTHFIVTSGISGWAIPFKTGTFSEFAVIDITGA